MNSLEKAMSLIASAGDSKSHSMEAIACAKEGRFEDAHACIERARHAMISAHDQQTDLIRGEVEGRGEAVTLLMVHAQDHLNGALLMREMAEEFVVLYQTLIGKEGG
ncbi:MAG: PTS lactose/cellobiose transporter subunit IIA [Oscillospiraceae bacterium]|jgi:PTS system cellobiose-specific IIA component|nr:PTS lactose/cellobiose transporter subunit IIA [Oscillospiraceae bacterium]